MPTWKAGHARVCNGKCTGDVSYAWYKRGLKFCRTCDSTFDIHDVTCPCCGTRLKGRLKPKDEAAP